MMNWLTKSLSGALAVGALLALVGLGALYVSHQLHNVAQEQARATAQERRAALTKLAQTRREREEIGNTLDQYQNLRRKGVVGLEHRLDWVDALLIVREENKLPDLKYSIAPQKPLDYPEVPKSNEIETLTSTMKLDLAMVHEGDLFRALAGLRRMLPPYVSVSDCSMERVESSSAQTSARLRGTCTLDLITLRENNGTTR